ANQGHAGAQSALSQLYFSGLGVPRDYIRAYTWASIAAGLSGNQNKELQEMASVMTELQLRAAQQRISNWWTRGEHRAENRQNHSSDCGFERGICTLRGGEKGRFWWCKTWQQDGLRPFRAQEAETRALRGPFFMGMFLPRRCFRCPLWRPLQLSRILVFSSRGRAGPSGR